MRRHNYTDRCMCTLLMCLVAIIIILLHLFIFLKCRPPIACLHDPVYHLWDPANGDAGYRSPWYVIEKRDIPEPSSMCVFLLGCIITVVISRKT